MHLTKKTHSCVRVEKDGRVLVIDPGGFSETDAAVGADAVLITHEHPDHFDEGRVRAALDADPAVEVWTLRSVADQLAGAYPGRVHTVGGGDTFTAAGFDVQVHGELHAVIHPDIPRITNVGYLVGGRVFHPGDAFTVPGVPVETLLLPVHAPWNKISEVIDYVREVRPQRAYDIHDVLLSDLARPVYDRQVGGLGGAEHLRLAPGDGARV
ncbi:MBL fold metallo-hydrolase [Streptomyces sp. NPDC050560]|uniref:MBL fold metallo-hydrolase n=1 Tax=Streptomyces sp. NPDC050560 TaxID=3365630 RepID=UPI0037889A6C